MSAGSSGAGERPAEVEAPAQLAGLERRYDDDVDALRAHAARVREALALEARALAAKIDPPAAGEAALGRDQ